MNANTQNCTEPGGKNVGTAKDISLHLMLTTNQRSYPFLCFLQDKSWFR
jgi:hypothetical protein